MSWYPWLKAIHVASILLFIGGLLAQSLIVAADRRPAAIVAHFGRWDRRVTVPAMLGAWLSGAALAASGGWFGAPWLWMKLVLVVALSALHGIHSGILRRSLHEERSAGSGPPHRLTFVALSAAAIAVLVVTKPL